MSDKHDLHHRRSSGCKQCKAREARIRELSELDTRWRPMYSAPKDMTVVDLRDSTRKERGFYRWNKRLSTWECVDDPAVYHTHADIDSWQWRDAHSDWENKS